MVRLTQQAVTTRRQTRSQAGRCDNPDAKPVHQLEATSWWHFAVKPGHKLVYVTTPTPDLVTSC